MRNMPECPERKDELEIVNSTIDTFLSIFGNRWNLLILYELFNGPKRFNELKRALDPITQTVLTRHLRSLMSYGVIDRVESDSGTHSVTYALSEMGYRSTPAMVDTYRWINELDHKAS